MKKLTLLISILLFCSCVMSPETYDPATDDGTYTGTATVYDGEGTDPDFVQRVCPTITASLTVSSGNISYNLSDDFNGYIHDGDVQTTHTGNSVVSLNNQFSISHDYSPGANVQSNDIALLKVCDTSFGPPRDLSNLSTLTINFGKTGFTGEFGFSQARASIFYGVTCSDGKFLPLCFYFWEGTK
ncbi:MAG: hypothetical protein KC478_03765 [Bacteriovoracaceae bacterium]|nr:hypothetical protein [Bacteriovoracaceae bacterium]